MQWNQRRGEKKVLLTDHLCVSIDLKWKDQRLIASYLENKGTELDFEQKSEIYTTEIY